MEDNATAARLFQIKLGNEGYTVDIARMVVRASTWRASVLYDLIAIDYNMPVQNGLNALRELVSEPDHPPVIFVTRRKMFPLRSKPCMGAIDYVVKGRGWTISNCCPA